MSLKLFIQLRVRDISTTRKQLHFQLYYDNHGSKFTATKKLAEAITKYPCLSSNSCKNYINKISVENAWTEVNREMSFEEGKINVTEASTEIYT